MKLLNFFLLVIALGTGVVPGRSQSQSSVVRLDPTLDGIVPGNAKVEQIANGFQIGTGPVWVHKSRGGYLLFSDLTANVIDKWTPDGKVSVFLKNSGFTGTDASDVGGEPNNGLTKGPTIGSNGLTLDRQGRVVFCTHGDRDVVRLEKNGNRTVLADRYEGKRLNSPNDLVYKSDGSLYFTDPTGGLRLRDKDPKRELPFNGVYLLKGGKLQLLSTQDIVDPNGLAFSPDEKYFYLNDTKKKIIMRFDVQSDDTITNGHLFIDMGGDQAVGGPDGMKVDKNGNVYCTGPGGLWIMSSDGKHLGTVLTPQRVTEPTFGDADGKTLYMTGITELFRIRLNVEGIRP